MSEEVQSGALPLLIPSENQRNAIGEMREAFVLNHNSIKEEELDLFFRFGLWVGYAIRSGQALNLTLHPTIWKRLVGQEDFTLRDLTLFDLHAANELKAIKEAAQAYQTDEEFQSIIDQNFTLSLGHGENRRLVELCPDGHHKLVSLSNYEEYI